MKNQIVLNFKNIISELKNKKLKLCFIKDNNSIFIEDVKGNLYQIENYRAGTYLDQLIKDNVVAKFDFVNVLLSKNIPDCRKQIWGVIEMENFVKNVFEIEYPNTYIY